MRCAFEPAGSKFWSSNGYEPECNSGMSSVCMMKRLELRLISGSRNLDDC